jgi:hypothetical protein
LNSCRRSCVDGQLNPAFIGFSPADIDSFVIRAYQPNSNYLQLVDTELIVKDGAGVCTTTNDTTVVLMLNPPQIVITSAYDWQIYLPAKQRTILVSAIMDQPTEGYSKVCYNPNTSFMQDGQLVVPQLVNTGTWYTSGYFFYINNN